MISEKTIWDIIKNIFVNKTTMFGLCISSFILLILPDYIISFLGLNSLMLRYRGLVSIVFICSLSIWLVLIIVKIINLIKFRRKIINSLKTLSNEEIFILAYCLWKNQQTIYLEIINKGAMALCSKGLLFHASKGSSIAFPFSIPEFVWKYLNRNRSLIVDLNDQSVIDSFKSYDKRTWMSY